MSDESGTEIPVVRIPASVFDGYIIKIKAIVDNWVDGKEAFRHFNASGDAESLLSGLPIKVGPGAQSGVVLRKSTFVELGNPSAGSCAFPLWSQDSDLLRDGQITLIGPDIGECEGESLPFAQVLMVAGAGLSYARQSDLEQVQYVGDQVEGYMIRSAPGRIWSRVSRDIMDKGFGFEMLGRALMALYKRTMPEIESMELLFVTSGRTAVEQIGAMSDEVRSLGDQFLKQEWLDRGIDLDTCMEHDCTSCHEKEDCDDIRDVVQLAQKAKREKKRQKAKLAPQAPD